ncbi:MAG: PfkB family carbohydrate kinase, partial [Merdibacter sp.]
PAPQGTLVNSVGAGDSMVAGFLSGYLESDGDHAYALRKGIAAGSASAFSEDLATAREVSMLLSRMNAS